MRPPDDATGAPDRGPHQSEAWHRALFDALDEGACVFERLPTRPDGLRDYRYVATNPAMQAMFGVSDLSGQSIRDHFPDEAEAWYDDYDRVLETGEPARITRASEPQGMVLEMFVARVEAGAGRRLLAVMRDVTEQKEAEARQAFLLALSDALRPLADPAAVQAAATRLALDHFGADRCYYVEVEGDDAVIQRDASREGQPSVAGTYSLAEMPLFRAVVDAGRPFTVEDVATTDKVDEGLRRLCLDLEVVSFLDVPVIKEGRATGILCVTQRTPRVWTEAEVALAEGVAERVWSADERARAEAALRQSEARYRTLFGSMSEGFCVIEMVYDEDGRATDYRFLETNPAFERHTGLGDAAGRTARELVPGLEDHWVETYARVAETGQPERFEQGSAVMGRLFEVEAFRVEPAEARRVGLLFADVTERRRAEHALRQSEERLRQAVEAARLGTWSYDPEAGLTHFDARARAIFGVDREALAPDEVVLLIHPEDREAFGAARTAALDPEGPDTFAETHRIVRPDGEVRWVEGQARVFFEGEGADRRPAQAVGVVLDVTERRAAEGARREADERFRRTAEAVPDILFMAGPGGTIGYVNARFEEVTGRPADEVLGTRAWDGLVHPDDVAVVERVFADRADREGPYEGRHRLRTAGGSYCWFLTRAQPVRDGDGRVEAWYGTATDIDRIVRAEGEVQALNATLERRVRERTALARRLLARLTSAEEAERTRISQVLHDDLQQRLYGLGLTLSLLRRRSADGRPTDSALLDRAEAVLDEAAALTRSLATDLNPVVLDATDLAETLEWLAEYAQTQYGLAVELAVAPGTEIADRDARVAVYQILRELLFNVVKHAGVGRARLAARAEGDAVVVTVEDEGAGFDPAVLDDAGGTGLGLASAQGRLDLVGGHVDVDTAPGRGTRVTVRVPGRTEGAGYP